MEKPLPVAETHVNDADAMKSHQRQLLMLGELVSGIAHEINTPVQYIGNNLQFISDASNSLGPIFEAYCKLAEAVDGNPDTAELIQNIRQLEESADLDFTLKELPYAITQSLEGVENVARLIAAMKEFSHPGGDEKEVNDINKMIQMTVSLCRNEWKYCAAVALDLDESLPLVSCYAGELNQVWLNLIVNAAHAIGQRNSDEQGGILISTRSEGGYAEVCFTDDGVGIPEHIKSKIFDAFFTTKKAGEGSGQGLSICREIVENRHGGNIKVISEEGKGTSFIIQLPFDSLSISQQQLDRETV